MKVLSIINISNYEDILSDSGFIFNYILASMFVKDKSEYAIVLPSQVKSCEKFANCKIYYSDIGTTKYESRFCFNWNNFKKIILDFEPDLIFLNQCELTAALKGLLISIKKENIKILTYCHYPALHIDENNNPILDTSLNNNNLGQNIIFNILSAVNIADIFVIQSQFAKNLLFNYAKKHNFNFNKNINVIPPPLDEALYNPKPIGLKKYGKEEFLAVYNHRLYKTYGADFIIKLIQNNPQNKFIVCNPMANRSKERNNYNSTPVENYEKLVSMQNVIGVNGSESREKYKECLQYGQVGIGCYRKACVWSMSVIDCFCVGIPVIAPNFAAYVEFVPEFLRFNNIQEASQLLQKLSSDKNFYKQAIKESREILKKLTPSHIYSQFKKLICEVV